MAKTGKHKSGHGQRRQEIRRNLPKPTTTLKSALMRPEFLRSGLIIFCFLVLTSLLVIWSSEQVLVRDGQLMSETRVKRLDYVVVDQVATENRREEALRSSPRIYEINRNAMSRLQSELEGLPTAVAGRTTLDELAEEIRTKFHLDEGALKLLQTMSVDGEPTPQWLGWVQQLVHPVVLSRTPILDEQEFQLYSITPIPNRLLLQDDGRRDTLRAEAVSLQKLEEEPDDRLVVDMILSAGFPASLASTIAGRIASEGLPTIILDGKLTETTSLQRASNIEPVLVEHEKGQVLFRRGDILTPAQYESVLLETQQFGALGGFPDRWLARLGLIGLLAGLSIFFAAYATTSWPKISRNPLRLIALAVLMTVMLGVSVFVSAEAVVFLWAATLAPILFVAMVVRLAYDQRLAIFLGGVQAAMTALSLQLGIGWFILAMVGCGAVVGQLSEVRDRHSLLHSALLGAVVLSIGTIVLGLVELPMVPAVWPQLLGQALLAAASSIGVGFLVLGILPSIERAFSITTGMTLAELRDPRRPLLQQLQQRAPGTYNHSLQVANIAEAAADAIGADSLLVYVGALYHDIGKMNKPEYFVENRGEGPNKHENLSPAMSLLVIIGHVKDGIELAREYHIPRQIIHFIEAHHGTTLVEYFYHAAKQQAQEDENVTVEEIEYRYPGPRPRTKEAAILMLSDCVESAARAMTERKPSQIEQLVRDLSMKRLMDGQFDECNLTFTELAQIQAAIVSRVNAIYHGRVSYPEEEADEQEPVANTA